MDKVNRKHQQQLRERLMEVSVKEQLETEKAKQKKNKVKYRYLMTGFYIGFLLASLIIYFTS